MASVAGRMRRTSRGIRAAALRMGEEAGPGALPGDVHSFPCARGGCREDNILACRARDALRPKQARCAGCAAGAPSPTRLRAAPVGLPLQPPSCGCAHRTLIGESAFRGVGARHAVLQALGSSALDRCGGPDCLGVVC